MKIGDFTIERFKVDCRALHQRQLGLRHHGRTDLSAGDFLECQHRGLVLIPRQGSFSAACELPGASCGDQRQLEVAGNMEQTVFDGYTCHAVQLQADTAKNTVTRLYAYSPARVHANGNRGVCWHHDG